MNAAGDVTELPGRDAPKRHSWPREAKEPVPPWLYPDGHTRHIRLCAECGLLKITVHTQSGRSWREWQHPDGMVKVGGATPPCVPQNKPEAKA